LELPGADCLDTWRDCWAVYKTAAVMLDLARPATLDIYAANFEERCRRYPRAWHLCAQADIRCRSEFMIDERRRQEAFHQRLPAISSFIATAPWDSVIKAAAVDAPFWEKELKEPALLYTLGHGKSEPSWVEKQPPQHGDAEPGSSRRAAKRKRELERKQNQQQQQQQQPPQKQQQQAKGGKGDGKGPHPRKGKEGRYSTTRDGSQICYAWNSAEGGCTNPCPSNRAHVCQRCLQPHRLINCHQGGGGGNKPHT